MVSAPSLLDFSACVFGDSESSNGEDCCASAAIGALVFAISDKMLQCHTDNVERKEKQELHDTWSMSFQASARAVRTAGICIASVLRRGQAHRSRNATRWADATGNVLAFRVASQGMEAQ
jgi:hypothetical protein